MNTFSGPILAETSDFSGAAAILQWPDLLFW